MVFWLVTNEQIVLMASRYLIVNHLRLSTRYIE